MFCNKTLTFTWVLNACANIGPLKKAGVLMSRSFELDGIQIFLWVLAWFACMQNVGALRMLGECPTRCHHMIWSLGIP